MCNIRKKNKSKKAYWLGHRCITISYTVSSQSYIYTPHHQPTNPHPTPDPYPLPWIFQLYLFLIFYFFRYESVGLGEGVGGESNILKLTDISISLLFSRGLKYKPHDKDGLQGTYNPNHLPRQESANPTPHPPLIIPSHSRVALSPSQFFPSSFHSETLYPIPSLSPHPHPPPPPTLLKSFPPWKERGGGRRRVYYQDDTDFWWNETEIEWTMGKTCQTETSYRERLAPIAMHKYMRQKIKHSDELPGAQRSKQKSASGCSFCFSFAFSHLFLCIIFLQLLIFFWFLVLLN